MAQGEPVGGVLGLLALKTPTAPYGLDRVEPPEQPLEQDLAASLESIGEMVKGLTEQVEEGHGPIQALAGALVTVMQCVGKIRTQSCHEANLGVELRTFRDQLRPILPRVDEYLPMAEPEDTP